MQSFSLAQPSVNRKLPFGPSAPLVKLTEKYQPRTLVDVVGQGAVVDRLQGFVDAPYPNVFLFCGDTGIGKSTCAIAMANDLDINLSWGDVDEIGSGECLDDRLDKALRLLHQRGVSGWRMLIIDEADTMSPKCKQVLLSAMDPRNIPSGVVIVLTTNHPDRFDQRFLDRCDRVDFASDCDLLTLDAQTLVNRIWLGETGSSEAPSVSELPNLCQAGAMSFRRVVNSVADLLRVRSIEPKAPVDPVASYIGGLNSPGKRAYATAYATFLSSPTREPADEPDYADFPGVSEDTYCDIHEALLDLVGPTAPTPEPSLPPAKFLDVAPISGGSSEPTPDPVKPKRARKPVKPTDGKPKAIRTERSYSGHARMIAALDGDDDGPKVIRTIPMPANISRPFAYSAEWEVYSYNGLEVVMAETSQRVFRLYSVADLEFDSAAPIPPTLPEPAPDPISGGSPDFPAAATLDPFEPDATELAETFDPVVDGPIEPARPSWLESEEVDDFEEVPEASFDPEPTEPEQLVRRWLGMINDCVWVGRAVGLTEADPFYEATRSAWQSMDEAQRESVDRLLDALDQPRYSLMLPLTPFARLVRFVELCSVGSVVSFPLKPRPDFPDRESLPDFVETQCQTNSSAISSPAPLSGRSPSLLATGRAIAGGIEIARSNQNHRSKQTISNGNPGNPGDVGENGPSVPATLPEPSLTSDHPRLAALASAWRLDACDEITIGATVYGVTLAPDGWDVCRADGTCYRVSVADDGAVECECPDYRFRRKGLDSGGCRHVKALRSNGYLPDWSDRAIELSRTFPAPPTFLEEPMHCPNPECREVLSADNDELICEGCGLEGCEECVDRQTCLCADCQPKEEPMPDARQQLADLGIEPVSGGSEEAGPIKRAMTKQDAISEANSLLDRWENEPNNRLEISEELIRLPRKVVLLLGCMAEESRVSLTPSFDHLMAYLDEAERADRFARYGQ